MQKRKQPYEHITPLETRRSLGRCWPLCLLSLVPLQARADAPGLHLGGGRSARLRLARELQAGDHRCRHARVSIGRQVAPRLHGRQRRGEDRPAEGIVLTYKFAAPAAAPCEIWNRIGYEACPLALRLAAGRRRVDDGRPNAQTIDLQQLQTWNPVAWLKLTTQTLTAGDHTLEIRLPPTKNDKGEVQSINYASGRHLRQRRPVPPERRVQAGRHELDDGRGQGRRRADVHRPRPRRAPRRRRSRSRATGRSRADDEGAVTDAAAPITEAPPADALFWKAMPVPGNRDAARPEWLYNHRYFLRTRVNVPAGLAGRSFFLHFPAVNMIASVFVNGQLCGTTKAPVRRLGLRRHQGHQAGRRQRGLGRHQGLVLRHPTGQGRGRRAVRQLRAGRLGDQVRPGDFTFPVWNHEDSGILRSRP